MINNYIVKIQNPPILIGIEGEQTIFIFAIRLGLVWKSALELQSYRSR